MLELTKKSPAEAILTIKGPVDRLERLRKAIHNIGFNIVESAHEPAISWRESLGVKPEEEPGCYLKGARLKEGLTQKELAGHLGISQHHISEMENNKRPIGKDMAKRLAAVLNVDHRVFL